MNNREIEMPTQVNKDELPIKVVSASVIEKLRADLRSYILHGHKKRQRSKQVNALLKLLNELDDKKNNQDQINIYISDKNLFIDLMNDIQQDGSKELLCITESIYSELFSSPVVKKEVEIKPADLLLDAIQRKANKLISKHHIKALGFKEKESLKLNIVKLLIDLTGLIPIIGGFIKETHHIVEETVELGKELYLLYENSHEISKTINTIKLLQHKISETAPQNIEETFCFERDNLAKYIGLSLTYQFLEVFRSIDTDSLDDFAEGLVENELYGKTDQVVKLISSNDNCELQTIVNHLGVCLTVYDDNQKNQSSQYYYAPKDWIYLDYARLGFRKIYSSMEDFHKGTMTIPSEKNSSLLSFNTIFEQHKQNKKIINAYLILKDLILANNEDAFKKIIQNLDSEKSGINEHTSRIFNTGNTNTYKKLFKAFKEKGVEYLIQNKRSTNNDNKNVNEEFWHNTLNQHRNFKVLRKKLSNFKIFDNDADSWKKVKALDLIPKVFKRF